MPLVYIAEASWSKARLLALDPTELWNQIEWEIQEMQTGDILTIMKTNVPTSELGDVFEFEGFCT